MRNSEVLGIALAIVVVILLVLGCMFLGPMYKVWYAGMEGTAEFRRAEQNKQIAIEEARAKMESAKLLANAEIERAKGVAEANKIIGESLENNDIYIRYLWVQTLSEPNQGRQIIYVPTEGNLPLLEASRLNQK